MQNLLSIEDKKKVSRLYNVRLFTVALTMACVVAIVSLVLLFALSLLLYTTSSDALKQVGSLQKEETSDERVTRQTYNAFFSNVAFLPVRPTGVLFSDVFDRVLLQKPADVFLKEVSFSGEVTKDAIGLVTLRGVAKNRAGLVSFIEALRKEPTFFNIDSPVSNLLKEQNLDFSLTISIRGATTTNNNNAKNS
jgi:hypothetical protein